MSFSAGDTASPFSLGVDGRSFSATTMNAIEAHLMEIASIRNPNPDSQGTVLAVVTFPKDDKSSRACDGEPWHDVRLRMDYGKLAGLGSKKINDMFSPRAQARFRRRLALTQLPPGIEYVLDFTPPSEGAELADLTAALWLPRMVKLWFLAGMYVPDPVLETGFGFLTRPLADKAVGAILALGHDDVCKGLGCLTDYAEWQTKEGLLGIVEDNPSARLGFIAPWRKLEDYCPIRHRVAIIRLLKAINGEDLLLNSAVRMWTVAQVAISLEVPQVVVDPVTQWLVAPPNTKFIEICPERAFQLAYALKIPSVLIAAFKILVNELAIDYASSNPLPGRAPLTWAQRRRDDYGDYPSDPIEYASRAFAERMGAKINMLQSDDVFNNLPIPIPEWDKLTAWGALINTHAPNSPLQTTYNNLRTALLGAFRGWIDKALDLDHFHNRADGRLSDLLEAQRRHYIPTTDLKPLISLYRPLNPTQKALTPFFWDSLAWTDPLSEFRASVPLASINNDRSLTRHADAFNTSFRRALINSAISPNDPALPPSSLPPSLANLNFVHHTTDFNLPSFHAALCEATKRLCAGVLSRARYTDAENSGIQFFLSDHLLLTLEEKELNYLPIWADGLDDGSGGVFQEVIPPAEMGPSEPGPGYHTGWTEAGTVRGMTEGGTSVAGFGEGDGGTERFAASTTMGGSDLGVGGLSLGGSGSGSGTAGRSLQVQESGASSAGVNSVTQGRAGLVVSAPSVSASESFTVDDESVYADARFAQPAAHQAQGQAIERYVDEAEAEEDARGEEGDAMMELNSDEEMEFGSDDGSSTLDGFEEVDFGEVR